MAKEDRSSPPSVVTLAHFGITRIDKKMWFCAYGFNFASLMGGEAVRSNGVVDAGSKLLAATLLTPILSGLTNRAAWSPSEIPQMLIEEPTASSNSGRCGIDTVPEEIWTQIIQSYALYEYVGFSSISVDLLLPLMLVSARWRRRIQDTPTLWTDIVLNYETEDLSSKVALGLHYSNTAPLSLCVVSGGTWSVVRSMAPSMQPRISALLISPMVPINEAEVVIDDLCPLPSLTRMIAPGYRYIKKDFFHQHPLIMDFDGGGMSITDRCACLPKLTKLRWQASEDISTAFQLLGKMQYLKEVALLYHVSFEEVGEFPPDFGSPPWTYLRCGLYQHSFHSVLLNQMKNTLTHLELKASTLSLVNHLSLVLPELGRLESFHLTLVDAKDHIDIPIRLPLKRKSCPVRTMSLRLYFRTEDHNSELLTMVGRVFRCMMEYAETITIFTRRLQYIPFLFVETGFPRLVSMSIFYIGSQDGDGSQLQQVQLPSSLKYLGLYGPQALLDMCGPTSVADLQLDGREQVTLKASQLSKWSNIRTLNLKGIESSFDHFNSPTLKVLSIDYPINMATVTALCHQLAIYDDRFPSLERLEFSECPEWDILMIMLERRNCKPDPAVASIKYIVLPARIPRIICSAVRERIQGRRSARPSNYELSLQGNIDIICDADLPGCLKCHLALRSCKKPVVSSTSTVPDVVIPYPGSDDEILSTWKRRNDEFHTYTLPTRSKRCSLDLNPAVHISEYSLEDPIFEREH